MKGKPKAVKVTRAVALRLLVILALVSLKKPTLNLRWAVIASAQGKVIIGLNKNTAY